MNVLIIEMYRNGVSLAADLARRPGIEKVIVVTDALDNSAWQTPNLSFISATDLSVNDILDLVDREKIDIAANFSSIYGAAGVVEALEKRGTRCVGSNKAFSETEINKRGFKRWLVDQEFKTPRILFEGTYSDILDQIKTFNFPLVIKPDRQIGPSVSVCNDADELNNYLSKAVKNTPYAKFGVLFLVEECINIVDTMHVMYFLDGERSFITDSVKTPEHWQNSARFSECFFSVSPHPKAYLFESELKRFLIRISKIADHAIGAIQCGITEHSELYFIENNARPATAMFTQLSNVIPCFHHDHSRVTFSRGSLHTTLQVDSSFKVAIALMHDTDKAEVDIETLMSIPHTDYAPFSLRESNGSFLSHTRSFPSILIVNGSSRKELISRIEECVNRIQSSGHFLKINSNEIAQMISYGDSLAA